MKKNLTCHHLKVEEESNMAALGDEEKVKKGKGLKFYFKQFANQLNITSTKTGNNSNKLKNEIMQILYLLYQHNKTTKKVYNNLNKLL